MALVVLIGFALGFWRIEYHPKGALFGFGIGIAAGFGSFLFYTALQHGPASLIVPFTSLYPLLVVPLAIIFFHESISVRQGVGVFLAVAAAILLTSK